jgi:hypothetical protein
VLARLSQAIALTWVASAIRELDDFAWRRATPEENDAGGAPLAGPSVACNVGDGSGEIVREQRKAG